jgi:hypothetical protein
MGNNLYGYQCLPASRGWPAELRILVTGGLKGCREQRVYIAVPLEEREAISGTSTGPASRRRWWQLWRKARGGHEDKGGDK